MTRARRALAICALAAACTLPPLRGRIEVGRDPYGVFVGEGSGGSDLYAFHGTTGTVVPITFSPVGERAPALAPEGGAVLFLRSPGTVWVMNLLSGAERELELPRRAPPTERAAWSPDGRSVYTEGGGRVWRFGMPPGSAPVELRPTERASADSAFMVLLGDPAFARAELCGGDTICVTTGDRKATLAHGVTAVARWGKDSVAWVREGAMEVRPLGGGTPRIVELDPPTQVTGGISYYGGR